MSGNWKNKLLNHQQPPPKAVWDSIAQKLDEDEKDDPGFAKKLENFEAPPPPAVWTAINNELDKEEEITISPKHKKNATVVYWRFAAAAAVVLIIGSVIWNLVTKTGDTKREIATTPAPVKKEIPKEESIVPVSANKDLIAVNDTTIKDKRSIPAKNKEIEKEEIEIDPGLIADNYIREEAVIPLAKDPFENNIEKIKTSDGSYAVNTDLINSPDRYVMVAGPDGISKRVSAKLSAYIGYLNDTAPETEEAIDAIIRESAVWKTRLKKWSNELINKPLSPTISNFLDLLELSDLLSGKK